MPQKNTLKEYVPHSYYHLFTRGTNKQKIFLESSDYRHFTSLFERYLSGEKKTNRVGIAYPSYCQQIELISYCLMANHIHLLIYQTDEPVAMRKFMGSLMTSYSKYYNQKYQRVGAVFESRYKAKRIDSDTYLLHISRYIHMNPRNWRTYRYSSLGFLYQKNSPKWLHCSLIYDEFNSREEYLHFLESYQENKNSLSEIKSQLANK